MDIDQTTDLISHLDLAGRDRLLAMIDAERLTVQAVPKASGEGFDRVVSVSISEVELLAAVGPIDG